MDRAVRIRFAWRDTAEQLDAFAARFPGACADAKGRSFAAPAEPAARVVLPFVLPHAVPGETAERYAARAPRRIGRQCVLLLHAGAVALGWWDEDELVAHKAMKKYVVRGSGKAQHKHLKTRGKSRYGSRLRLQNRARLLAQTNERLHAWWEQHGAPEAVFLAVNVRALPDLYAAEPAPPFDRDDARVRRIPLHVHVPDFAELQRVRSRLAHGTVELPPSAAPPPAEG